MQAEDEKTEADIAADQRSALRASLERERDGYKTRGLGERVSQVEEQIRLLDGERNPAPPEKTTHADSAPLENAAESKPRRTARSAKS